IVLEFSFYLYGFAGGSKCVEIAPVKIMAIWFWQDTSIVTLDYPVECLFAQQKKAPISFYRYWGFHIIMVIIS
ncbi:MAG: hypothetical protein AAB069_04860, partial [Planctomycetota bacterium]